MARRTPVPRAAEQVDDPNAAGDAPHESGTEHQANARDVLDELKPDDPATREIAESWESEAAGTKEPKRPPMLRDVATLPPTLSIAEAGAWLGIGRNTAFKLAREGSFPVRTLRIGNQRRVATAEMLTLLGITPTP